MSITLTSEEIAYIRGDINELLPDTGYILTVTNTNDGAGGVTESIGTSTAYKCRIDTQVNQLLKSGEFATGGGMAPFHRFVCTLPYDTVITTDNRFLCNSTTYNIIAVDSIKSWKASVRVYLEIT